MTRGIELQPAEIHAAFNVDGLIDRIGPVLGPTGCAEMLGLSVDTIYSWLETGRLHGCHRRRGKRQLIWRDRAILLTFNGSLAGKAPFPRPRPGEPGIGLTDSEINQAFAGLNQTFPPILSPDRLAELLGLSRSTVYLWIQQAHFTGAVTKRGKRRMFWRTRAIRALFNGPEWNNEEDQ